MGKESRSLFCQAMTTGSTMAKPAARVVVLVCVDVSYTGFLLAEPMSLVMAVS